jgi:type 2 lantibiotic biosynthesis protein LanM
MTMELESLETRLLREGWSLHDRLRASATLNIRRSGDKCLDLKGKLDAWCSAVAPDDASNFDKRLRWDGLTLASAGWALQPDDTLVPVDPAWWGSLQQIREAAQQAAIPSAFIDPLADRGSNLAFVHVWRPAAHWALQRLQHQCSEQVPRLVISDEAWLDLGASLLERLCTVADQALWELFNRRRTPGQMLLAHLGTSGDGTGEPVHVAYDGFVAELLATGYGLLLGEFPVLGRLLAVITDLWLEACMEMLEHVDASRQELEQLFRIQSAAVLQGIQLGLSDPHRGGRAVAILSFASMSEDDRTKVVYKPKDMQVDLAYQQLLQHLNTASSLEPLRCLTVMSKGNYGFMEWVEHRTCNNDAELAHFYCNAGRTMAVLHLLGCTDCHYENLIASGDQLVLIDTETLLEAELRDLISDDGDNPDALSLLQTSVQGSVLRSGLLPHWLVAGAGRKRVIDISALGIEPPPPEREMPGWLGLNSDGMMAGCITKPCELPTSLPVGLGSEQRLTDFVDELCGGFRAQLQEAIRLRHVWQELLEAFHDKPRRLVARATRLYFTIQRQMLEPAALRSAFAHGLRLEQLSRSFLLASEKPLNWSMFHAELNQMERLDIPFFDHLIDGEELPLSDGLPPISGFMKASGLVAAEQRLQDLDENEINFQQELIRGAITVRHLKVGQPSATTEMLKKPAASGALLAADIYCQEAFRLGEEVWASAIRDRKGRPEWLGMDLGGDGESFHFGLIGHSLYSGASGIALLFARLVLASEGEEARKWQRRAWACFESLAELAERNSNDQLFRFVRDLPYGINGSGGILLALKLLEQADLPLAAPLADLLLQQLRTERILSDEGVDLIGGVTGLIGPLLLQSRPEALDLAQACGDRLLALQLENGGWPSGETNIGNRKRPLTGLSHGASGMSAALARLAQASGETRFADAALRAVAYERSLYVNEQGNWPDFRATNEPNQFMLTWCHGAPGILLARLILQAAGLGDDQTLIEISAARRSTLTSLKQFSSRTAVDAAHLCCGVLGLTSLLRVNAQVSCAMVDDWVSAAEHHLIRGAQASGGYTLFSVDNGSVNLPGLFEGKAGVALALLEASTGQRCMPQVLSGGLLAIH